MFRWIRRLLDRDAGRLIFHYRDGRRRRSADPEVVERTLKSCLGPEWVARVRDFRKPRSVEAVGVQAIEQEGDRDAEELLILKAIDLAFGVRPYTDHNGKADPEGLTDGERKGLLEGYMRFQADLIELARPFVNARRRDSPSPASPPTPNGAASTPPSGGSNSNADDASPTRSPTASSSI